MVLCYAKESHVGAEAIAAASDHMISLYRGNTGDVNWGRARASTRLNANIANSVNKCRMRQLFQAHGVPMPRLLTVDEARQHISQGGMVVGRPDRHTRGKGFWWCASQRQLDRALRGTLLKQAATHFMELVQHEHEFRVHIFQGRSIRISEKLFANDDYTTIKPTVGVKKVRQAAKQAVEAVGLDFAAVDVLKDAANNVYVLEVNAAPGLGGSMPKLWADTFMSWEAQQ